LHTPDPWLRLEGFGVDAADAIDQDRVDREETS